MRKNGKKTASKPSAPKNTLNKSAGCCSGFKNKLHFTCPACTGTIFLFLVLVLLSLMVGVSFQPRVALYSVGEIATQNITAKKDFLVEEKDSTQSKRDEVADSQPVVFDLDLEKAHDLRNRVGSIFNTVNKARLDQLEQIRWQIAETLNSEISRDTLDIVRNNEIQNLILIRVLPWLVKEFSRGVVMDSRLLQRLEHGILVRSLATKEETFRLDLHQLMDLELLKQDLETYLRTDLHKPLRIRNAILELLEPMLQASLVPNSEATRQHREKAKEAVDPVYYHIKRGEVIVRAGERVDEQDQLKLQALYQQETDYFHIYAPLGVLLIGLFLSLGLVLSPSGPLLRPLSTRDAVLVGVVVLLFVAPARFLVELQAPMAGELQLFSTAISGDMFPHSYPVAGAAGLLGLFLSPTLCCFAVLLISFLCCQMVSGGLNLFLFYFLGGMLHMVLVKRTENRPEALKNLLPLLLGLILIWLGIRFLDFQDFRGFWIELLLVGGNACLSLLALFGLSPIIEMLFGYSSRFKLMEQMNLEQPLLQELMVAVPGTYHHSLIVANMVEAGARAVGANALLCKVSALYHDIGKIKNPQYFIENQYGCRNIHDKLTPSMSALILISHVKKGVELARQHKLGQEIIDIIQQHHGTSIISFFYNKALEQALTKGEETVRDEDYRYPGPKPQTKEAGIVMLADAIEASSRTLVDPTPGKLRNHVETIVKKIFSEGQLDESPLTLKDLNQLTVIFSRILTGIFHQRIAYPDTKETLHRAGEKKAVRRPHQGDQDGPLPLTEPLQ